jgi:sulfite oxidase
MIKKHPGGSEKVMLGAGGSLEPFFAFYPFHRKEHIIKWLNMYRIGTLHPDDRIKEKEIERTD